MSHQNQNLRLPPPTAYTLALQATWLLKTVDCRRVHSRARLLETFLLGAQLNAVLAIAADTSAHSACWLLATLLWKAGDPIRRLHRGEKRLRPAAGVLFQRLSIAAA